VPDAEPPNRLANVTRFIRIQRSSLSFSHGAETAMPRADVSKDHEGRGALAPALKYVWTPGLLADRVKAKIADHLIYPVEGFTRVDSNF
jgi:hypothetical protein